MRCRKMKFPQPLSSCGEIAILEKFHCGDCSERKVAFWKEKIQSIHRGGYSRRAKSYPDSCAHLFSLQTVPVSSGEDHRSLSGGGGRTIAWFGSSTGYKQLLHCCFLPSPLVPLALLHEIWQGWCHCQGQRRSLSSGL